MKKIIAGLLAIFILSTSLAGCKDNSGDGVTGITRYTTDGKTTKMVADETLSGELNVDLGVFGNYSAQELEKAEKLYRHFYPSVKLTVKKYELGDPTYDYIAANKKMQTEIMTGKGPDVFVSDYSLNDCYKQMEAGIYADLTEYFENDKNFNVFDFAENVLYAGQFDGRQYLVPAFFETNSLITTQSIINEIGFNEKKNNDFLSLEEELLRVLKENKLKCDPKYALPGFSISYWFLNDLDTTWIDYSKNKVYLDGNENVKKAFENGKKFMPYNSLINPTDGKPYGSGVNLSISAFEALQLKTSMFITYKIQHRTLYNLIQTYRDIRAGGDNLVLIPIKDFNGKTSAMARCGIGVNANSENIPAAYAFIKLLISNEYLKIMIDEEGRHSFPGEDLSQFHLNRKFFKELVLKQGNSGDKTFDEKMNIIPAYLITEEDADELTNLIYSSEVCRLNSFNVYGVMDEMDSFILKGGSYDKAIESAQNYAEIYVSE